MSHWWRAHDEAVDDPKLQLLPPAVFKGWFNLMCLASANSGRLPSLATIAFKLHLTQAKAKHIVAELTARGLLDEHDGGFVPHNWNARQFKSDVSTERVQRFRERRRNVSEAPPDTERTETDSERKEDSIPADAGPPTAVYAFESGVIRLKQKDFDQWKAAYSHLDLAAELIAMTEWAGTLEPGRWFPAVSNNLAKKNRELGLRLAQSKNGPEFKWKSGIEGVQ